MKKAIRIVVLSSLCWLCAACSSNIIYSDFRSVPLQGWAADSVLWFSFDIMDTVSTYEMQICVRHTEQYPFQNMWLFVSDSVSQDTIEFYMADDRGEWLGNGHHNGILEMPVLYEENYHFPHAGRQVLGVRHGMREEYLRGIADVGIVIKKNGEE
ncbi:MAG: gliding motility lipoprotein GldH [Paludibacteraceae bacterium]